MSLGAQPEVAFHFNVGDPLGYLCRLLRKVDQAGLSALVCVPDAAALDRALWSFAAGEFIAHARWDERSAARERSKILIADRALEWEQAQVLVNALPLPGLPPGYERCAKVIEIVGLDAQGRDAARQRWKAYAARGHQLLRHDAARQAA